MKKGLSVLLIAAALFGFYGGAVNLNDILACKDYWEEAGEKSTADMNKLEDGLNQLKDNEQAYLDGLDQVADGEAALAEGEATLAKGEADYAAAPGKLKAGEQQLAEGEDSYADLQRLIKGLKTARKHGVESTKTHDTYWHDAFTNALRPGRKQIVEKLGSTAPMIGMLAGDTTLGQNINDKASYPDFDKDVQKLVKAIPIASSTLKTFAGLANSYASNEDLTNAAGILTNNTAAEQAAAAGAAAIISGVQDAIEAKTHTRPSEEDVKAILADPATATAYGIDEDTITKYGALTGPYAKFAVRKAAREGVQDAMGAAKAQLGDKLGLVQALNADLYTAIATSMATLSDNKTETSDADFASAINTLGTSLKTLATTLNGLATQLDGGLADLKKWDGGFKTLYNAKDASGSDDLASKSEGIPFAFNSMLTNKTLKSALKKYDKKLIKELKKYKGDRLKNDSMTEFDDDLTYISNTLIPRSLKVLAKVKASAAKQLADGRKQLAQGRKDYAEAPAKLAEGRQQLADGRAQLAAGKDQLAQYEDGEQQVRDGLATLVGTEPDLELESILDRLNGDSDFDNGDEHLDLDEGLAAVEVGRGYQAEDGELITKEIMTRAIGTGGLLAAGVLAVLAAILSFMKKNKGAGVCAILAAAAGAFGAFEATQAGTYFSNIAGSTVGQTGLYAAGALAVVALVHAIAHFTAKKEA